jgi:hypothetical protein
MSDTNIKKPEGQPHTDYLKRDQMDLCAAVPPAKPGMMPFSRGIEPDAKDAVFHGKLIVAVHGMGNQVRNDFAQTMARMFARYFALQKEGSLQALLLPLGTWDGGRETDVDDPAVRFEAAPGCEELENYAFAELFWADIPRTLEADGYRLEEATHWARTVVQRLAQRHGKATDLGPKQFHLAGFVLEEVAETVQLVERIAATGKMFGISKQVVAQALTQYLNDVQQVADFQRQREKIRERFLNRLEKLHEFYPKAEIHIIAHSEGTVTSLFTLLSSMCEEGRAEVQALRVEAARQKAQQRGKEREFDPTKTNPHDYGWLGMLRSYTTMGSPIDKHLHLWPEMWRLFEKGVTWIPTGPKVRWRNFYDYADPVGYELDSARMKLEVWGCKTFQFEPKVHDHGYRRYPLPGQAHLDYFTDDGLFAHVIEDAVLAKEDAVEAPQSNWRGVLSPVVPFALVAGLLFGAVFVLHRALLPKEGAGELHDCIRKLCGVAAKQSAHKEWLAQMKSAASYGPLGCWAMLAGSTMLARIVRLTRDPWMVALAVGAFVAGAAVLWLSPGPFVLEAGYRVGGFVFKATGDLPLLESASKIAFIVWSLMCVGLAWGADFLACAWRWKPLWALRLLILAGTAMLGAMLVVPRLIEASGDSAWTLLGGLGGFAALWWVATLLFDLSFCWQRYINTGNSWLDRLWPERKKVE